MTKFFIMDLFNLDFVKLSPNIKTPTKTTQFSVGSDIYSPKDYILTPQNQMIIPTGLRIKVPNVHYGHLCSKSGLAIRHKIHVGAGVIDPDYTGEIKVLLLNLGTEPFEILVGTAIAQLIFEKISIPILHKVDTLPTTDRGDRGCGFAKSNTL